MSATRTVELEAPFEGSWIEVNLAIKMGTFVTLKEKTLAAIESRQFDDIRECLALAAPLVVATNLVDVETAGPATFSFDELSMDQVRAVMSALVDVFVTGGGSADPLSSTPSEPPSLPGPSSPDSPSPQDSGSGSSPADPPATTPPGSTLPSSK